METCCDEYIVYRILKNTNSLYSEDYWKWDKHYHYQKMVNDEISSLRKIDAPLWFQNLFSVIYTQLRCQAVKDDTL